MTEYSKFFIHVGPYDWHIYTWWLITFHGIMPADDWNLDRIIKGR